MTESASTNAPIGRALTACRGHSRGTVLLVIAFVMAVGLAACGSSTSSSASGPAKARTASASTWVIGNIGSYSGPESTSTLGSKYGMDAWAKWVDAHGGIDGHPVKVDFLDDALDPSTAITDVNELVSQDHAIAIVGEGSDVVPSWAATAEQLGVPVVGGGAVDTTWTTNPDFFPASTTTTQLQAGMLALGRQEGGPKTKLAVLYCTESSACSAGLPLYQSDAAALGMKIVYVGAVSASAPNYTAPCLAARNAGANEMFVIQAASVVTRIASDCATQGFRPKEISNDGTINSSWLDVPALDGVVLAEGDFPFSDSSTPATRDFQAALKEYEPGAALTTYLGPNDVYSWTAGQLFAAAAQAAKLGNDPTSAQVKHGLDLLPPGFTEGGLTPPLTFHAGKPSSPVSCYFVLSVEHGHYVEPQGLHVSCPSS